jgi:hypothetical protein
VQSEDLQYLAFLVVIRLSHGSLRACETSNTLLAELAISWWERFAASMRSLLSASRARSSHCNLAIVDLPMLTQMASKQCQREHRGALNLATSQTARPDARLDQRQPLVGPIESL